MFCQKVAQLPAPKTFTNPLKMEIRSIMFPLLRLSKETMLWQDTRTYKVIFSLLDPSISRAATHPIQA
jgi:hypothetical protein